MTSTGKIGPLTYTKYYFTAPPPGAWMGLAKVFHSPSRPRGFLSRRRYTLMIPLSKDSEKMLSAMRSTWKRHIKQAQALGGRYRADVPQEEFVDFFNHFADKKGIAPFDPREDLYFTQMWFEDQVYTFHAYSRDPDRGLVRLRHSSSIRLDEGADTERVALLNKLHHYEDFLHFAGQNYGEYDFGGCQSPAIREASPLHFFKTGFGGAITEDWQGSSPLLALLDAVLSLVSRKAR